MFGMGMNPMLAYAEEVSASALFKSTVIHAASSISSVYVGAHMRKVFKSSWLTAFSGAVTFLSVQVGLRALAESDDKDFDWSRADRIGCMVAAASFVGFLKLAKQRNMI